MDVRYGLGIVNGGKDGWMKGMDVRLCWLI